MAKALHKIDAIDKTTLKKFDIKTWCINTWCKKYDTKFKKRTNHRAYSFRYCFWWQRICQN